MRLLLNQRLHVNMGEFEHMEITASIEVDTDKDGDLLKELWVNPNEPDEIEKFIHARLESMLAPGAEDAYYLTKKNADESFIHAYHKEHSKEGH